MKGMVFTEFLEMVENRFSWDMVDELLDQCSLASGGVYTAVGTYPYEELVSLVQALAQQTDRSVASLLNEFGEYLFGRFAVNYPVFFTQSTDCFTFLAGIEHIIHAEVRKLYPDAQLPRFIVEVHNAQQLQLLYESERHLEDLAEGLITGCIKHFGHTIHLTRETVNNTGMEGTQGTDGRKQERFLLSRHEYVDTH